MFENIPSERNTVIKTVIKIKTVIAPINANVFPSIGLKLSIVVIDSSLIPIIIPPIIDIIIPII